MARDSLIYLLQGLSFLITKKKSIFAARLKLRVSRSRNKLERYDFNTSGGGKEQNSGTVSISIEETISDYQRVN